LRNYYLECLSCQKTYELRDDLSVCPECGGPLVPRTSKIENLKEKECTGIWRWKDYIPFAANITSEITLYEGKTPLIRGKKLEEHFGCGPIYIKDESRNPTGTFIDRGSAVLTSYAKSNNVKSITVPSLGDLGVSISAYSRHAGLHTTIYLPKTAPVSKYYQTLLLADSVRVRDNYESLLEEVKKIRLKHTLVAYPWDSRLIAGYRTLVYEIVKELRDVSTVVVPMGNGVLLLSVWYTFLDLGLKPTIIGVRGSKVHPVIMDISVERSKILDFAVSCVKESGGEIISVDVEDALEASYMLATLEGFMLEPVGASTLSALIRKALDPPVVLIMTGSTLKDPMMIEKMITRKRGRSIARSLGITKLRILEILSMEGSTYPYRVWKLLREYYGISIALRNVYKHIKDLEDMGLIKKVEERRQGKRTITYYSLSEPSFMHH